MTREPNDVLLAEAAGEGILLLTMNRPTQHMRSIPSCSTP